MDEELPVKVTRLRRRLSTEAESVQSPLTPSTPTRKRGTKLAKPALELIDENVTENVQKKASTKDAEPANDKSVTPSRRSTRIRSNTSLLMEATQNIVSESPRAKRALRRNSQIGSDTESVTTPARRTRTRKDSTSSVEKLVATNSNEKVIVQVAEAISEESEKEVSKDSKLNISQNSTPVRKSPRLNKKGNKITEESKDVDEEANHNDPTPTNTSKLTEDTSSLNELTTIDNASTSNTYDNIRTYSRTTTPKKSTDFNKSVSSPIEELQNDKDNKKRTKSLTITANASTENIPDEFASGDSIMEKTEMKSSNKSMNKSASIYNTSIGNKENILLKAVPAMDTSDTIKILQTTPSKDIKSVVLMEDSDSNSGSEKLTIDIANDGEGDKNDYGDQCVPVLKQATPKRLASESFNVEPMDIDETIPENVTINDFSDKSNSSKDESKVPDLKKDLSISNEKSNDIQKSPRKSTRTSISLQQESNSSKSIQASEENKDFKDALNASCLSEKSPRKSSISILYEYDKMSETSNKSKRKSSLSKVDSDNEKLKSSNSFLIEEKIESSNKSKRKSTSETETQNLEKSSNDNKSTLVLSQLKDVSNETSNVSKSPNDTNNELTKSVNINAKETDKIKQSNYLTSTPLQQKPLQKLAMQINTSVISPNIESKNTSKANKSKTPLKNANNSSHNSESSDESDEDSMEKSKMIDDEAEEASDDYESGDSRDAEEIQYEKDHEIIEKGETLESETHLSNDSESDEYEKDSFVVSSDEEDDGLLSGSGDDLSLTDNELKMTAKSKKKFDDRKRKEQKNASREMYEARHQLNESDKSISNSKKFKGRKLESSASESEKDDTQSKKKNRLRIDSSQDVSMNNSEAEESPHVKKKKKSKRLSESVCEDKPNEKEITFQNQSAFERNDPLVVAIKQEPKTPQKDFNMSTVLINDNIEQVQIDTNATVMKSNETSDPLQTSQAHDDVESDSDISENLEIKENYDSVLENLNKANSKLKTADTSLNFNRKAKDKIKEPIIDQLNLTQTKKSKKAKSQIAKDSAAEKSTNENVVVPLQKQEDGDNSDSIDMRLLFPEDSNDSEANAIKFKPNKNVEPTDELQPSKETEPKINHENMDVSEDTNVGFFIDTTGTYEDTDTSSLNSSKKNKKKHKQNVSVDNVEANIYLAAPEYELGSANPNDSLKKDKKKKNKSFNHSQTDEEPVVNLLEVGAKYDQPYFASEETADISLNSEKKKKKKNKSLDASQIGEYAAPEETPTNVSLNSGKKKKNKSLLDVSQLVEDAAPEETPVNISINSEKKKKKKNKSQLDISQIVEDAVPEETPLDILTYSDKKKKKNKSFDGSLAVENIATEETAANVSIKSDKKKKNRSLIGDEIKENAAPEKTNEDISLKREKKKKQIMPIDFFQNVDNMGEDSDGAPDEVAYKSEKKSDNIEPVEDDTLTKSKNKFKKRKKNKRKQLQAGDTNADVDEGKAKKRKHDQSSSDVAGDESPMSKSQKKKKLYPNDEAGGSTSKSNKRKASEEEIHKTPKVFKENFFQKIHVSRLPDSVINQLDDQPTSQKSKKQGFVMSTVPFEVEERPQRRNKPSNYLEQSIYLNDPTSPVKLKKKVKNPKVLPFTPTVITSGEGFTSKFQINVLPQETQFVAQASNMRNFKDRYLSKQRSRKIKVERFKKRGNQNLAKF